MCCQGSNIACSFRPLSWSKEFTLKQCGTTVHMVGRNDKCLSLNQNFSLSIGASRFRGRKVKYLKISAFKGSARQDVPKMSFQRSYVPKESEETATERPKAHNVPLSYTSETNENMAGSPVIHKLFMKWLTMLRTQLPSQVMNGELEDEPSTSEKSEALIETQSKEESGGRGSSAPFLGSGCRNKDPLIDICFDSNGPLSQRSRVRALGMEKITAGRALPLSGPTRLESDYGAFGFSELIGLDQKNKPSMHTVVPWFLAVNVVYGAKVSKELAPLWVFGPIVVALYIKFLRGLCALYVFTFKQMVKIIKNLPTYYMMAKGKLKEDLQAHVGQPLEDIKNMDYKHFSRKEFQVQEWLKEKYLDFVESIWPYYCRSIRFLKRANLI